MPSITIKENRMPPLKKLFHASEPRSSKSIASLHSRLAEEQDTSANESLEELQGGWIRARLVAFKTHLGGRLTISVACHTFASPLAPTLLLLLRLCILGRERLRPTEPSKAVRSSTRSPS